MPKFILPEFCAIQHTLINDNYLVSNLLTDQGGALWGTEYVDSCESVFLNLEAGKCLSNFRIIFLSSKSKL